MPVFDLVLRLRGLPREKWSRYEHSYVGFRVSHLSSFAGLDPDLPTVDLVVYYWCWLVLRSSKKCIDPSTSHAGL